MSQISGGRVRKVGVVVDLISEGVVVWTESIRSALLGSD